MFAIAWKDIRERWWVAGLVTVTTIAGFAVLLSVEPLRPVAIVELLVFLAFAVTLAGALAFADERAKRTDRFLADLPEPTLRIWASKAAASFVIMALVVIVGLYAAWAVAHVLGASEVLGNLEDMSISLPFRAVLPIAFFWAMGLFFSVVFERAMLGAVVGTFVSVGLSLVFFPVQVFAATAMGESAVGHGFPPFTRVDQAFLAGLTIFLPLAGSFLGYAWSRHHRTRIWQRAAFLGATAAIWMVACGTVTACAVVRGETSTAYADWVKSDGSGGFVLASEGGQRGWPWAIVHRKADGSVCAFREVVRRGSVVSGAASGKTYAFMPWYASSSPARYVIGLTILGLFDLPDGLGGRWLRTRLRDHATPLRGKPGPAIMDLETGTVTPLDGWRDDEVRRFPLGWDEQGRLLALEKSGGDIVVRFFSADGIEVWETEIPFKDPGWANVAPISAGMRHGAIYVSAHEIPEGVDATRQLTARLLQATYDPATGAVTERASNREKGQIAYSHDLSCRFEMDPPNADVNSSRPVAGWAGQAGIDESITFRQRGDSVSTARLYVVGQAGQRTPIGSLETAKTMLTIDYRVLDHHSALVALVTKRVEENEGSWRSKVTQRRFLRVDLASGSVIDKTPPEGTRGFMVSPDGETALLFGVEHPEQDGEKRNAPRVPWVASYATSDLHLTKRFEWPEKEGSQLLSYWYPGAGDWLTDTEIVMATGERIAQISLATGEWKELSVAELIAKGKY